jgi:hypothetical protein
MAKRIFISYRREDTASAAGRVYDRLCRFLPPSDVFIDVNTIRGGEKFEEAVVATLEKSDALLAFIGRKWLDPSEGGKPRICEPDDYVRAELRLALSSPGKLVLPVLVDGAQMPKGEMLPADVRSITVRNAVSLRHERFDDDTENILAAIFGDLGKGRPWDGRSNVLVRLGYVFAGSLLGLLALTLASLVHFLVVAQPLSASIGDPPTTLLMIASAIVGAAAGLRYENYKRQRRAESGSPGT